VLHSVQIAGSWRYTRAGMNGSMPVKRDVRALGTGAHADNFDGCAGGRTYMQQQQLQQQQQQGRTEHVRQLFIVKVLLVVLTCEQCRVRARRPGWTALLGPCNSSNKRMHAHLLRSRCASTACYEITTCMRLMLLRKCSGSLNLLHEASGCC
jgi:hypothetical protein